MESYSQLKPHRDSWLCGSPCFLFEQISNNVLEQITSFASGTSYHLPLAHHIQLIFDLMEPALNINGLIDFAIQVSTDSTVPFALLRKQASQTLDMFLVSLSFPFVDLKTGCHYIGCLHLK